MIITVLDTVVSQMTANSQTAGTYEFVLGDPATINADIDEMNYCLVAAVQPIANDLSLEQGGYKSRTYDLLLWFLMKTDTDETPVQMDANAITPARNAVIDFINRLEEHADVDSVDKNAKEMEVLRFLDLNTSGIILRIKVKLRSTNTTCIP